MSGVILPSRIGDFLTRYLMQPLIGNPHISVSFWIFRGDWQSATHPQAASGDWEMLRFLGVGKLKEVRGVLTELGSFTQRGPAARLYSYAIVETEKNKDVRINGFLAYTNIENELGNEVTLFIQPTRTIFSPLVALNCLVAKNGTSGTEGLTFSGFIGAVLLHLFMAGVRTGLLLCVNWIIIVLFLYPMYAGPYGIYWLSATLFIPLAGIWQNGIVTVIALWRGYRIRCNATRQGVQATTPSGRAVVEI